ncbi:bifunctional DNA primase/polymerase [Salipiger mucosus]|uniref:DNA primase/polymerase bifunctional N-terminal domain-containing protein n=1 Tax=Salipiger mucosus DSM 16094 TaxID=1123237 RepID=S9QR80_9RHOB|nr:bifunctional DNA primase/polymerase [Salipiger mucosus]EPX82118.1 hypothetical protein Salmuc_02487 [Salipiger mucosus DSM 16094]
MVTNQKAEVSVDEDNPFAAAGENIVDLENGRPKDIPDDRLPVGRHFFNRPHRQSPYHTERAARARSRAAAVLPPEHIGAAQEALGSLIGRSNENYADATDHNIMSLAYACWYAEMGWAVADAYSFSDQGNACGKGKDGKVPLGAQWQLRATSDHAAVIAAWCGDGKYPPIESGGDKGKELPYYKPTYPRNISFVIPKGYWVLDADSREELARLEAEFGPLPDTVRSASGSGKGEHILFRTDLDIRNTASIVAKKIDVRGFGGQIIVEPSLHKSGGFYRWADGCAPWECEVARAPEAWEQAAFNATKSRTVRKSRTTSDKSSTKTGRRPDEAKARVSDAHGFENILATIGDQEGGAGFDSPVYRAACSWFSVHGHDAEASELHKTLRDAILAAQCDDDRAETRYASEDYLETRIEQAREYIADGEDNPFEPLPGDLGDETKTPEERAEGVTTASKAADIRKFFKALWRDGVDEMTKANVTAVIVKNTNLDKRRVQVFWKELDAASRKPQAGEVQEGMLTTAPAPDQTQYAADAVRTANEKTPFLFEYMEEPTIVRRGRIKSLDRPGKRHALGRVTVFQKLKGEGEMQHVYPPYDVVDDLFSSELSDFCLPLRGAVDTPFFAADGALVTTNGYHAGSQMYLDNDLELAGVSPHPTAEEVQDAKRLIVDNVLADFPLGGLSRQEIMAALDGETVPAVTHAVGLTLLPFMREMIDGPTPGWILSKPAPGTGASLLVKLLTTIGSGVPAPESTLPSNKEEVPKTLAALLQNDPTHIVFDNINHSVDSGDLASAQTARTYQARVLGKTQTIEVDVRSIFMFTANNVTLSKELLRRSIFIPLDAKVEAPEKRTGFLHEDVSKWVDTHRAELVHACLTLIQNWVAQGMQRSSHSLASFEDWAKVTGGVLEAAGFTGFLEGQEDAKALAADAAQENTNHLMDVLADYPDGTQFRPGGTAKFNSEKTVNLVDILNGEERAKIEPGDDKPDPIQIKSWGYSDYDGCYKTGARVRPGFEKLTRKPHRGRSGDGREYDLHFEALPDTKNKGVVFRMRKVPVSDGK